MSSRRSEPRSVVPAGLDLLWALMPTTEVVGYCQKSLRDKQIPAVRPVRDAVRIAQQFLLLGLDGSTTASPAGTTESLSPPQADYPIPARIEPCRAYRVFTGVRDAAVPGHAASLRTGYPWYVVLLTVRPCDAWEDPEPRDTWGLSAIDLPKTIDTKKPQKGLKCVPASGRRT